MQMGRGLGHGCRGNASTGGLGNGRGRTIIRGGHEPGQGTAGLGQCQRDVSPAGHSHSTIPVATANNYEYTPKDAPSESTLEDYNNINKYEDALQDALNEVMALMPNSDSLVFNRCNLERYPNMQSLRLLGRCALQMSETLRTNHVVNPIGRIFHQKSFTA